MSTVHTRETNMLQGCLRVNKSTKLHGSTAMPTPSSAAQPARRRRSSPSEELHPEANPASLVTDESSARAQVVKTAVPTQPHCSLKETAL